jgi:prevent-host-death family protein
MHRTAATLKRAKPGARPRRAGTRWQLQEAKARLSRVVKDAQTKGPQIITVHGEEVAVVESMEDYRRRSGGKKNRDWLEVLLKCPPGPPLARPRDSDESVGAGTPSIFG